MSYQTSGHFFFYFIFFSRNSQKAIQLLLEKKCDTRYDREKFDLPPQDNFSFLALVQK